MTEKRELVLERVFDAPREEVFQAWTEPERMKHWFGPKTFTTPVCDIDLRKDGGFHLAMQSPEGKNYWVKGAYREIAEPERIVYADYFSDEEGHVVPPEDYGMSPEWPRETLVTVTFEEDENQNTRMTMRSNVPDIKEAEMAEQGWNESFDKLAREVQ